MSEIEVDLEKVRWVGGRKQTYGGGTKSKKTQGLQLGLGSSKKIIMDNRARRDWEFSMEEKSIWTSLTRAEQLDRENGSLRSRFGV